MLKLLFFAGIIYIVYRYFQMKSQLKTGAKNGQQHFQPPQDQPGRGKEDYIDYEEIK